MLSIISRVGTGKGIKKLLGNVMEKLKESGTFDKLKIEFIKFCITVVQNKCRKPIFCITIICILQINLFLYMQQKFAIRVRENEKMVRVS